MKKLTDEIFVYYLPKKWGYVGDWEHSRSECFAEIFAEHFHPKKPSQISLARLMPRMRQSMEDIIYQADRAVVSLVPELSDKTPHTPQTRAGLHRSR